MTSRPALEKGSLSLVYGLDAPAATGVKRSYGSVRHPDLQKTAN